ncbi:MAG: gamma-glutamyl-gamma-aminobutyrate hydrolase family protein, partial [Actinomycetota bacterium]
DVLSCSSHHHQGVDRVGEGLAATGWSADGLVEALERIVDDPDQGAWRLGVQWHPEDTAAGEPAQPAIFAGFAVVSGRRGSATPSSPK